MLNLYTETAAQVAPATTSSVLEFTIPRKNGSYDRSRSSTLTSESHTRDEQDYSQYQLASAGDIYFRESKSYQPRSILWRVTSDQRVLELFPVDLSRSEDDSTEAHLTLRFTFQDAILPSSVAISDSEAEAELHVFICTSRNELFHLRLHPDGFRTADAISQDVGTWCSALEISSLAIETIFRIHVHTPFEIVISHTSGKLQRLQRKVDSHTWTPENYDDRTWGASFRGLVGRGTVRTLDYGSQHVDSRAVQAMQLSADSNHLFTVCLNHQLRVWHLASGRLVVATDLLDKAREVQERLSLNPAERGHLQLFKLEHMKHPILISYSPHEGGQFKFWDVRGGLTEALSVEDRYPAIKLTPPDPDPSGNTIWSMAGFKVVPCDVDPMSSVRIWILWRNNNHHQLYTTRFVLNDPDRSWKSEWVSSVPSASNKPTPPDLIKSSPEDVTTQWLNLLLCPGRYTNAVLETALSIYAEAISAKLPASQKADGVKARLCSVIGANVSLRRYDQTVIDYDRFTTDVDYQWRNFWRIVEKINEGRLAPLALAFDLFTSQPWIVMADKCCAVRECSKLELVSQNQPEELDDLDGTCDTLWAHRKVGAEERGIPYEKLAQFVITARNFRYDFPSELAYKVEVAIEEALLTNPESITYSRILELYDSVGFSEAVSDDTFHRLQKDFKSVGELDNISDDLLLAVLDLLPIASPRPASQLRSTVFGQSILAAGTLDSMVSTSQILWDLLALIIFIEGELNQDEEKIAGFDAAELFTIISTALKPLNRNIWLATHTRAVSLELEGPSPDSLFKRRRSTIPAEEQRIVSILQDSLWKAIRPRPVVEVPNSFLLTETLHEIQDWVTGDDALGFGNGSVYLHCDLLVHGEADLATEFLQFQPSSAWSTYVKGRLYLSTNQCDLAAQYFQRCTYAMARGKAVGDLKTMSAGLLSAIEVDSFNNGIPRYLHHVLSLFQAAEAYSHSASFARLALQSLVPGEKEPSSGFQTDVLHRLFAAEVQGLQFGSAFDALVQIPDQELQKSCTTSLINAVLDSSKSDVSLSVAGRTLQSLPWALHPVLSRQLDTQLTSLAKKQKSVTSEGKSFANTDGGVDYLKIVHAIRVARHDYRGAVEVLYERLRLIVKSRKGRADPTMQALRHAYLGLINEMTLISPDEAYILAETEEPEEAEMNGETNDALGARKRQKVIITLESLRKQYQKVLDRCSRVERGDFGFDDAGSDSEADGDDEVGVHERISVGVWHK